MMGEGIMHGMPMNMGIWWLINLVFGVLIVSGIVLLVVWIVKRNVKGHGAAGDSALDILKKRYARGEITKEEFEAMKKDIA